MASIDGGLSAGAEAVHRVTRAQSASCTAEPKFIVVGFSQGAIVARLLAQLYPRAVVGVVTIGDPVQKAGASGNEGTGAHGTGIIRSSFPYYQERLDRFYSLAAHKSALCHADDPFCDFRGEDSLLALLSPAAHFSYMTGPFSSEASVKGKEIADLAREQHGGSSAPVAADASSRSREGLRIGVSMLATARVPTTVVVTGGAVSHGARRIVFDLNGDGVFETVSATGIVETTFSTAGAATVSARITDERGRHSDARETVDVAPAEALDRTLETSETAVSTDAS